MTINNILRTFVALSGLVSAVVAPVTIDDKPRTLIDWGIPSTEKSAPILVVDNYQNLLYGQTPTTVKSYLVNGFRIEEHSSKGELLRIHVIRPDSSVIEVYVNKGNSYVERMS